jgi:hypothetical protein
MFRVEDGFGEFFGSDIDGNILRLRYFLAHALEITGGDLERIEDCGGHFLVDDHVEGQGDDAGDGELDGSCVLENGQHELAGKKSHGTPRAVEITEALAAQGGRSALNTVRLNMMATF